MNQSNINVPWVALWTSERDSLRTVNVTSNGICGRRDRHGIYWIQYGDSVGVGEPLFGQVHTDRQVNCMRKTLCQVCGQKISRTDCYWILNKVESQDLKDGKCFVTQTPPVCANCIKIATEQCPHLISMGKDVPLLRVFNYSCVAVNGDLALPGKEVQRHVILQYGHPKIKYLLGRQLIVELKQWERMRI